MNDEINIYCSRCHAEACGAWCHEYYFNNVHTQLMITLFLESLREMSPQAPPPKAIRTLVAIYISQFFVY